MKLIIKIPHLEGGIPILDQTLEFPFEGQTPLHEETHEKEVPPTSPKQKVQVDDVIEMIQRMNLEGNEEPPVDQPGLSQKFLKWTIETIESDNPYEVGNPRTRRLTR